MIRTLNSLRFILILMIVISHSTLPMSQGLHDYLGECPVAIFFVISGFVLSLSKGEKLEKGELSNKQFFLSRIFKLYPLHLLIVALIIPLDWRLGYIKPLYQVLAHCLLLQCWYPTHSFVSALNAATWFLSDIIFFYLVFKYLYHWIIKCSWSKSIPIIGVYTALYIVISLYCKEDYSAGFIYCFPPFRMIDFIIGILLYKFYMSKQGNALVEFISKNFSSWRAYPADIMLVLIFIGMYYLSINTNPNIRCASIYWIPASIIIFYVTICDCKIGGFLNHLLHNKVLLWLGGISFEIYLCHCLAFRIIQSIFLKIYGEDISYLGVQFLLSLAFTMMMAWISKKYIVIPIFNKLK